MQGPKPLRLLACAATVRAAHMEARGLGWREDYPVATFSLPLLWQGVAGVELDSCLVNDSVHVFSF